jgi:hypothetical protein
MFVGPAYVLNVKDVEMTHGCVPDPDPVSSFDCGAGLFTAKKCFRSGGYPDIQHRGNEFVVWPHRLEAGLV